MRFHHIGLACSNIDREAHEHRLLGYLPDGAAFDDPIQRIRGCFMLHGAMRIELLQPTAADSPLQPYLRRGIKMYHQAFEVTDLDRPMQKLIDAGALPCGAPAPAIAFGGRLIVFLMLRSQLLVELIETR